MHYDEAATTQSTGSGAADRKSGDRESGMKFSQSNVLRQRAHRTIPGGAHTYAKGDDQYPVESPGFISHGRGCHVWDVDGNEFIEYGMGLRSVTLGHGFQPVVEAVSERLAQGVNFTRPAAIELECAERLQSVNANAEMVKFAKNGSDVTTAAVKLARAYTGRDMIAVCSDHPFFSVDDWFIGTTAMPAGIPQVVRGLTVAFHFNDTESVRAVFERYPERVACLVMEPELVDHNDATFLREARTIAHEYGALFILDEIITGFRLHEGGVQTLCGVVPDLSTFGKALGNGFAISALVGRRDVMELGGLLHDSERVFLLSTTFGAETHALAAAIKVMQTYRREGVIEALRRKGERLIAGVSQLAVAAGVQDYFGVSGHPSNLVYYTLDNSLERSQPFRTLFLQETIKRGLLMPSLVVSFAHTDADLDRTIESVGEALTVYRCALEDGVEKYLHGRSIAPVFRERNQGIVKAQLEQAGAEVM